MVSYRLPTMEWRPELRGWQLISPLHGVVLYIEEHEVMLRDVPLRKALLDKLMTHHWVIALGGNRRERLLRELGLR